MQKLISLMNFRNSLESRLEKLPSGLAEFVDEKGILLKMVEVESFGSGYDTELDQEIANLQQFFNHMETIVENLKNLISKIDSEIALIGNSIAEDTSFQERFQNPADWELLLNFNKPLADLIQIRIKQYCDWQYPGLSLNTATSEFIDSMVACDPLYLVSRDLDQLKLFVARYPEMYQNRLRLYAQEQISILPHAQFGFILMWNYLEFCPLTVVREHLKTVLHLLRPGGVFMFSYANGDVPETANLIIKGRLNFGSAKIISAICQELGFEIISQNNALSCGHERTHISWMEVRKPGELITVKAHQALGKIIPK
jgi:SAM-dependent methyltransferase